MNVDKKTTTCFQSFISKAETAACNYCMCYNTVTVKQFHGLIYILQSIYNTNSRRANLPAIHHTDIVTLCHMEKCWWLSIHNYRFADKTLCALRSSCLTLDTFACP